jgi:hypothetical protein
LLNFSQLVPVADRRSAPWTQQPSNWLAIAAACVFIVVASYKIALPGLYFDEMIFADAAQGSLDTARVHMHVGSVPLLIMPYIGALKAWIYIPIFRLLGVSALTTRLPVILIAAATLLILFGAMRPTLGGTWAAIVVWLLALDPANIFPSRLDWGPTLLMHLFKASILDRNYPYGMIVYDDAGNQYRFVDTGGRLGKQIVLARTTRSGFTAATSSAIKPTCGVPLASLL